MSKLILSLLVLVSFLFVFSSSAQTFTPDFQAVIKQLQEQIKLLNQQIAELQSSLKETQKEVEIVKTELKLTKSLKKGESSDEVKQLQEFLRQFPDIYPEGIVTGFFGSLTETAVRRFQEKHGIESIGIVGPKTIQKLNEFSVSGAPAIPTIPAIPMVPAIPVIPAILASPSLPLQPAFSSQPTAIPAIPATPAIPAVPEVSSATPAVPATPAQPSSSTSTPTPTPSVSISPSPTPTPAPTPTPTPVPASNKPAVVSFTGSDGTWCYDSDYYPEAPWSHRLTTKGYCQDNTGAYYNDSCWSDGKTIDEYSCFYSSYYDAGVIKSTTRCERDGFGCSGPFGNACSDGVCINTVTPTPTPIPTSTPTPTPTPVPAPTGSVSFSPLNQASATANILDALKSILQTLSNLLSR